MTGLTIGPIPISAAQAPRTGDPAAQQAPVTSNRPASTAQVADPVLQIQGSERAELLVRKPMDPPLLRRKRSVGPPPAFEINLLQHLQESRARPPALLDDTDHSLLGMEDPTAQSEGDTTQGPDQTRRSGASPDPDPSSTDPAQAPGPKDITNHTAEGPERSLPTGAYVAPTEDVERQVNTRL